MPERARPVLGLRRTSVRLSVQFALLYAVLSGVMFLGAYLMTDIEVRDWIEDQMRADAVALQKVGADDGAAALARRVADLGEFNFQNERIYQLRGPDDAHLAGTRIDIAQADAHGYLPAAAIGGAPAPEVSGYWIRSDRIGDLTLIQGTGDHVMAEVMEALGAALIAGYVLVISAGLVIGQFVGVRTERRIGRIMQTLETVSGGALAARIPASGRGRDDLSRVSGAVNAMLDRIEALLESQQQIATDIAHDLRTPLQRLRQRLERMIDGGADEASLQAALGETENLIETFKALLRIAQVESGMQHDHFVPVDLAAIARDVAEIYQPVAEDEGQLLIASVPEGAAWTCGDAALLGQLLANLIENAIRHCPPGATFEVTLEDGADGPVLSVADDGPGIAPGETEKVFRRFYRSDKSRSSQGHGLGLPLVKAIGRLHGARIDLADNAPGLRVTIRFARATDSGPAEARAPA